MTELELIFDLHLDGHRQGPGSKDITLKAFSLTGLSKENNLKILDIGCGTGAQTIDLAQHTHASITALDFSAEFLGELKNRAKLLQLSDRIQCVESSMTELPFEKESFDLIWSEGAIYSMGFEKGIQYWKQFLKPNGVLAVSEITWTKMNPPAELVEYWNQAYSEMDFISNKIQLLEHCGYSPLAHLVLPENCWMEEYYHPMLQRFDAFMERNGKEAELLVQIEKDEIDFYQKYKDFYSYGFFIAKKNQDQ